jgi:hypothetical protein
VLQSVVSFVFCAVSNLCIPISVFLLSTVSLLFSVMIFSFFHSAVASGPSIAIFSSVCFCKNLIHIPVDMAVLVTTYIYRNHAV